MLLLVCLVTGVFFVKGIVLLDPDFGWHLKMGELITSTGGVPATDPFSYTMSSFPFIDHEWLTNVTLSKLYFRLGNIGLSAVSSLLALSALAISVANPLSRKAPAKGLNFARKAAIPFLLGAATLLLYSGVRPQVLSWFLFAILLWIVFNREIWRRWRSFLPILYVVWVNLHGSFSAGLASLYLVLVLRAIRVRRVDIKDLIAGLLSLLATFVNPYGPRIWHEVWLQVSDTSLRWTIVEWMPALLSFSVSLAVLIPLSLLFLAKYRKKFYLEEKGLYLVFLIQGLASTRHIPLWVMVALPVLSLCLEYFYKELEKIPYGTVRFSKTYKFAILGCLGIFVFQSTLSLNGSRLQVEEAFYPSKAVSYIRQQLPAGQIFSSYGWGGYLIWKLPEKKVFIDGRMPSWRWEANLPQESNYAMKDYQNLLSGKVSSKEVFEKYGISTVLWPRPMDVGFLDYLDDKMDQFLSRFGKKRHDFNLYKELERNGWSRVYEDSVSVIYQKRK